jgi:hypothetical protein
MFKDLVVALAPPVPEKSRKKKPAPENLPLKQFLHEIRRFPFYAELDKAWAASSRPWQRPASTAPSSRPCSRPPGSASPTSPKA